MTDDPGVPIFCPLCEADVGPIWPKPPNGRFPKVLHHEGGMHTFDWSVPEPQEGDTE